MKNRLFPLVLIIIGLLFAVNTNTFGQNNPDNGEQIKFQLHKFFYKGDSQKGNDDIIRVRKRLELHEGNNECKGFVDEDGDGVCDNCGGVGECDRTRDQEGKLKKFKGGN